MVTFQEAFEASDGDEQSDVELPAEGGQEVDRGEDSEVVTETSSFDLDAYGSQTVDITVDGEVQQVPVSELRNGYMRQASFTQKSQTLAEERQRLDGAQALASAYANDPETTVRFLAEQAGITLGEATAVAEAAEQDSWADDGTHDPRMDLFEQRFAELDAREARFEVEGTLWNLGQRYGDAFDQSAVIARAIEDRSDNLEATFMQMQGEKAMGQQYAAAEIARKAAEGDASATAAKAALAETVGTGGSSNGAGTSSPAPITTVAGALAAALGDSDLW
jgi:hypothetical protein